MSKSVARVALPVLVSLVVIFAIFTTVQGASIKQVVDKVGSHSVSGVMTNFNHDRLNVAEQEAYQAQLDALNQSYSSPAGPGHGCEDQNFNSPLD
jgi:hypothetical protein